jgi:hypothetical protein
MSWKRTGKVEYIAVEVQLLCRCMFVVFFRYCLDMQRLIPSVHKIAFVIV